MVSPAPSPRTVRRIAGALRFQIGPLEKALRLAGILAAIADHDGLRSCLVLKGGTALNLYHADLPRLSVDADLNFIGAADLEGMRQERVVLFRRIEALAAEAGYQPRILKDVHALRAYLLDYRAASGNTDHIKLDINMLDRVPAVVPIERLPAPAVFEIEGPPVPCLSLPELAGSKLATLLLRGATRDLFDVAQLASRPLDWAAARKVALFHGLLDHPALGTFDPGRPDVITEMDIRTDLTNQLRKGARVSATALRAAARPAIDRLLPLSRSELACLEALAEGRWEPDMLFEDVPVNPELRRHPGMLWRLRHPGARMPH